MCCFLDYAETMSTNSYFWKNFRQGAASVRLFPSHLNYEEEVQAVLTQVKHREKITPGISSSELVERVYMERFIGAASVFTYMLTGLAGIVYLAFYSTEWLASVAAIWLLASQIYINWKWQ